MPEAETLTQIVGNLETIGNYLALIAGFLFILASMAITNYIFPHRKN